MTDSITIGRLAQAAAVNVETIRYYQRRGLVGEPVKPLGGHRRYPPEAVKRVRFIKRAQNLGFTLDEVRGLLALDDGQSCRVRVRQAAAFVSHYCNFVGRSLSNSERPSRSHRGEQHGIIGEG
ncbi:MAG: MerR family transcriptional regulator [Betaproteobacteria bacterium]|nr:MAG: MerR family transcriptional regulator [Betaproteobacteria bacterium]